MWVQTLSKQKLRHRAAPHVLKLLLAYNNLCRAQTLKHRLARFTLFTLGFIKLPVDKFRLQLIA